MNELTNELREAIAYEKFNNITEMMKVYMSLAESNWDIKTDRARDHLDMLQAYIVEFRDLLDEIDDLAK